MMMMNLGVIMKVFEFVVVACDDFSGGFKVNFGLEKSKK